MYLALVARVLRSPRRSTISLFLLEFLRLFRERASKWATDGWMKWTKWWPRCYQTEIYTMLYITRLSVSVCCQLSGPTRFHHAQHSKSIPHTNNKHENLGEMLCCEFNLSSSFESPRRGEDDTNAVRRWSTSNIQLWLLLFKYFNSTTAIFHLSLFTCANVTVLKIHMAAMPH